MYLFYKVIVIVETLAIFRKYIKTNLSLKFNSNWYVCSIRIIIRI